MRILVIAPSPPRRDGIAVYARDQAERLRAEGHEVTVLSPHDGDGDERAEFLGGAALRRASAIGDRFERIVVHFQPSLYLPPRRPGPKVAAAWSLLRLAARHGPRLDVVVHEADPPTLWRPDYLLLRGAFRRAGTVTFHTRREWVDLERRYRVRVRGRVVPHRVDPASGTGPSRQAARAALGLAAGGVVFVCPGFLQPSKGYDRAVSAFADLNGAVPASLYVVGSVRQPTSENLAYAEDLRARTGATPRATLVERFVDDEEFDRWIAAADCIVLPYRRSWSSGVLARAHALGTPAIVTSVGGLAEQAGTDDVVVEDDEGLRRAMRERADG